jgi:hypothetical protein
MAQKRKRKKTPAAAGGEAGKGLGDLRRDVAEMRATLDDIQNGRKLIEVKVSVTGPRRAGILVDQQAIELPGSNAQSGKRRIELEAPNVDVILGVKGRVGTKVTMEIEINGKSKKEEFWTTSESERRPFTFPFSDFGL